MRERLTKVSPELRAIVTRAFPEYRGRKFYLEYRDKVNCRSYWDGGSRSRFVLVRVSDMAILPLPTSHPVFDRATATGTEAGNAIENVEVQRGCVLLEHSIFMGKDAGITVYVNPSVVAAENARQQAANVFTNINAETVLRLVSGEKE